MQKCSNENIVFIAFKLVELVNNFNAYKNLHIILHYCIYALFKDGIYEIKG